LFNTLKTTCQQACKRTATKNHLLEDNTLEVQKGQSTSLCFIESAGRSTFCWLPEPYFFVQKVKDSNTHTQTKTNPSCTSDVILAAGKFTHFPASHAKGHAENTQKNNMIM
jgi:hypothetical protein